MVWHAGVALRELLEGDSVLGKNGFFGGHVTIFEFQVPIFKLSFHSRCVIS